MMDQTLVNTLLTNLYKTSSATLFTPGTGGTAFSITLPYKLKLMTTAGTEAATGTELSGATGYPAGGSSLGTVFAGTIATGTFTNANAVSWSVGSSWTTVNGVEVYDSSGTPVRHLWGTVTAISGLASPDTLQFPAGSITVNASNW
jgi:hypothetical protein